MSNFYIKFKTNTTFSKITIRTSILTYKINTQNYRDIDNRQSINPVAFKILSKSSTSFGILGKVILLFTQIIKDGTYIMLLSSLNFLSSLSLSVLVESK